jgi:uncharacterized protein (DUF1697 family)
MDPVVAARRGKVQQPTRSTSERANASEGRIATFAIRPSDASIATMTQFVAFLRAVNVGGNRPTPMARLREEFAAFGYEDITTFLNSGNVIFETAGKASELEAEIEAALEHAFGFEVTTFVRTATEVKKIAAREPFGKLPAGDSHMVAFVQKRLGAPAKRALAELESETDRFVVDAREVHWHIRGGQMASSVKPRAFIRACGEQSNTTRNTTMLRKLVAKLG